MPLLEQIQDIYARFMKGRSGADHLSLCCLSAALFFSLIAILSGWLIFTLLSAALYGWALFRMLSRNVRSRIRENGIFLQRSAQIREWIMSKLGSRSTGAAKAGSAGTAAPQAGAPRTSADGYKRFRCPGCGNPMRMPVWLGEKRVTCPRCRRAFPQRS